MMVIEVYDQLPADEDPLTYCATCDWCTNPDGKWRARHIGARGEVLGECLCDDCENRLQHITEQASRRAYQMSLNSQLAEEYFKQFFGVARCEDVAALELDSVEKHVAANRKDTDTRPITDLEIAILVQDYALFQSVFH